PPAPDEEEARFRGRVREAGTRQPLPEADIRVVMEGGATFMSTTDDNGYFEMADVPAGRALITVAHTDHENYQTVEDLTDDDVVEVQYFLPRRSYNKFETVIRDRTP